MDKMSIVRFNGKGIEGVKSMIFEYIFSNDVGYGQTSKLFWIVVVFGRSRKCLMYFTYAKQNQIIFILELVCKDEWVEPFILFGHTII